MTMNVIYIEKNAADKFILVVKYKGVLYACIVEADEIALYMKLDKASRNGGYSLRFKPNRAERENLIFNHKSFPLCDTGKFNAMYKRSKYNRGEVVEREVFRKFNQYWKKDTIPFWIDGDITIDGIKYQIKYEKATFITEAQARRLG